MNKEVIENILIRTLTVLFLFGTVIFSSMSLRSDASTPTYSYKWKQSAITVYLYDAYGNSTIKSAVSAGLKKWNSTDAPTVKVITNTYLDGTYNISAFIDTYGNTSWDARTNTKYSNTTNYVKGSAIHVNVSNLKKYKSVSGLWTAISCHEMGHSLGLKHNVLVADKSIMKKYTIEYYDYKDGSIKLTGPTSIDKTAINKKY